MDMKSFLNSLPDEEGRKAFAARCNTSIGHLRNVMYGYKTASVELAVAVELESGGAVTCNELRPTLAWVRIRDRAWPKGARPVWDVAYPNGATSRLMVSKP